jgi:hypothetical protein
LYDFEKKRSLFFGFQVLNFISRFKISAGKILELQLKFQNVFVSFSRVKTGFAKENTQFSLFTCFLGTVSPFGELLPRKHENNENLVFSFANPVLTHENETKTF